MVNRGTPAFAWHEGSPREDLGNIPEGAPAVRWKPWTSPLLLSGTRSLKFLELWREPLLTRITTSGNLHDLPGLERSAYFLILEYWGINISLATERAFLVAQWVKNLLAMQEITCNAGDLILIPGLGRSSEKGNGNPLHYSCLENTTDRGTWWVMVHRVAKSDVI